MINNQHCKCIPEKAPTCSQRSLLAAAFAVVPHFVPGSDQRLASNPAKMATPKPTAKKATAAANTQAAQPKTEAPTAAASSTAMGSRATTCTV